MKYCPNCGSQVEQDAQFCDICGTKVVAYPINQNQHQPHQNQYPTQGYNPNYQPHYYQPAPTSINVNAIIGFVLSLTVYPVGLVFSIIGLVEVKKFHHGKGLAIAGIIISGILLLADIYTALQQIVLP